MIVDPLPAAAAKAVAASSQAFAACALCAVGDLKGNSLVRSAASQYDSVNYDKKMTER